MKQNDLKKIADAIADGMMAKRAPMPGCGDQSSSQNFRCTAGNVFSCGTYECGGAGNFTCGMGPTDMFGCLTVFDCDSNFTCQDSQWFNCRNTFRCSTFSY